MMTNSHIILNRDGIPIAYDYTQGQFPLVLFLSGFRSDMMGTKAQFIKQRCLARGQACLLMDYAGHGQSGGVFEEGSIQSWYHDVIDVVNKIIPNDAPILVVGSSMGGWIALHVALSQKTQVRGFIGIAPAPDFTRHIWNHEMDDQMRHDVEMNGVIYQPSEYGDPLPISYKLIKDSEAMCLMDGVIDLTIPITILQGRADPDVPWTWAEALARNLPQSPVSLHINKDGDDRTTRPEDLELVDRTDIDMLAKIS